MKTLYVIGGIIAVGAIIAQPLLLAVVVGVLLVGLIVGVVGKWNT